MPVYSLSPTSRDIVAGDIWVISVKAQEECIAAPADTMITGQVTAPDDTTAALVFENTSAGIWIAVVDVDDPGRYLATVVVDGYGMAAFTAYATAPTAGTGMPTLADLVGDRTQDFGYLGENSFSDADVQDALDAESAAQRDVCTVPAAYPDSLAQALKRRVAVNLARRAHALGLLTGDADTGDATRLPGQDPEVRRLERPYPRLVMG